MALLRSSSIPAKHRDSLFFTVQESKLLREMVCVRGMYQYIKQRMLDICSEVALRTASAVGHRREWSTAFCAEQAAETAHRGCAVLVALGNFAQIPEDVLQSRENPKLRP